MRCINNLHYHFLLLHILSFIGFLFLLRFFSPLFNWVFTRFFLKPKPLVETYGSWALVTGATDGIGRAFANRLAQTGLNLVLVGRNPTKLTDVSLEIQQRFPNTKINIITFDFSSDSSGLKTAIENGIRGLEVGILINNVGITYPNAMFFHEVEEETWMNIVRVNLEATTLVTKAVLKEMIQRRRGAIVNIGSAAATVVPSHPLFAIYAATKAYVDQFSRSLHVEYKQFGIDVQCQVPLYVATRMVRRVASVEKPGMFVPTPEEYAKSAVNRIGIGARCTPFWAHSLQWFAVRFLPNCLLDKWRLSVGLRRSQRGCE